MKLKSLFLLVFAALIMHVNGVMAQNTSFACLGKLCYINVDLATTDKAFLTYTINVPKEYQSNSYGIAGPASPHLQNFLGDSVDIVLNRNQLIIESDEQNCQLIINLFVDKWVDQFGNKSNTPGNQYYQCYYDIVLLIQQ